MRTLLFSVLGLFLAGTVSAQTTPNEKTVRNAAQAFLKAVAADTMQNPETAGYFTNIKSKPIELNEAKATDAEGWIYHWSYKNGITYILNPDLHAPLATVPRFTDGNGIIIDVFVAYKHGDDLISRSRNYPIFEDPDLHVALYLKTSRGTGTKDDMYDQIMAKHLPDLEKALASQ